jgi:Leu/Phe-tRNA-protein transferase
MKIKLISMLFISAISLATFGADFCIGDNLVRTVNGHHYNVRVLEIYQDGTIDVEYTNNQFSNDNINIRELSRALSQLDDIRVGDNLVRTVNGHHYNVRVLEIYQDGTVDVEYTNSQFSNDNISIRELSRALNELDGVQVGDNLVRTVNGHHYNVRVLEIYQDETVEVAYISGQYSNDNINIRELSRARHCTELESCSK